MGIFLKDAGSDVQIQFEKLLQGETIEEPISKNLTFNNFESQEGALWSLLIYTGYLKVVSTRMTELKLFAQLAIPNKEINYLYNEIISGWFLIETNLECI